MPDNQDVHCIHCALHVNFKIPGRMQKPTTCLQTMVTIANEEGRQLITGFPVTTKFGVA